MKIQLPDFRAASVLVVGDIMLDQYWYGVTNRISPEAPVPVVKVENSEFRPGGAGNVALNLAELGAKVTLMGLVGDDEAAKTLKEKLTGKNVDCQFEPVKGFKTITKLRVISHQQQLIRLDFETGCDGIDCKSLLDSFEEQVEQADAIILSDYGKGTLRYAKELIRMARDKNKFVLVDPKSTDFADYQRSSIITPNLKEFEAVVGACKGSEEIARKGFALMDECQLDALLITRSEHGVTLLQKGEDPVHLPTHAREVFDVTGAGDTVISLLAAALAAGQDFVSATALANLGAGVVVGKLGTATASVDELTQAIHERDGSGIEHVKTRDELKNAIEKAKAQGEKVVFTNGCFDILHAGHVQYLRQARMLGDKLIVAVNSDESVRQLKGETRPINPLADRMTILGALDCVDWVVPFSEETPESLICHLVPNFLVKGGDYKPKDIAGYDCVVDAGGEVLVLDFVEGRSTSATIKKIQDK
jgi:D-beta-D-heptose 7-phosphate kinase / D-beta-D-heptose 1-phosphate adenosyltransferase